MRKLLESLMCAVVLTGVASAPASAIPLIKDAGWSVFYFGGAYPSPDSGFEDLDGDPLDFSFSLSAPTNLYVADGYFDGDQFSIFNNGNYIGSTSTPVFDGTYIGDDFTAALKNPDFSSAVYSLGPGTYDISGVAIQSPFGYGAGGIALGAIPEPGTWALMTIGFGIAGFALRRRTSPLASA